MHASLVFAPAQAYLIQKKKKKKKKKKYIDIYIYIYGKLEAED